MVHATADGNQGRTPARRHDRRRPQRLHRRGSSHGHAARRSDRAESRRAVLGRRKRAPVGRRSWVLLPTGPTRIIAKWRSARRRVRTASRPSSSSLRTTCTSPQRRPSSKPASTSFATSPCRRRSPKRRNWSSSRARRGSSFAVTLNNTAYPMVRQAREMIEGGGDRRHPRRPHGLCPGLADLADRG